MRRRVLSLLLPLLGALPAQDPGAFAAAVADYRAGRYDAAFAVFQREFAAAGEAAAAELRWNLALAALRVQRSADAEAAVAPWLAERDGRRRAEAEFVAAMAAHQRALRSAAAAELADAEPLAWAAAVLQMERAVAGFERAAGFAEGWPEAARNAGRARDALAELRRRQEAARAPEARQEPAPQPDPPPAPASPGEEEPVAVPRERLSAGELERLRQRVARREQEKHAARRAERQREVVVGGRAW